MAKLLGINPIISENSIPDVLPDNNDIIKSLEYAAAIHKEVRKHLYTILKPNITLGSIVKAVEDKTIELSNSKISINKGIGFPVGLSINGCAAHFHPHVNDKTKLKTDDIIKIDYGTEVNGWIIDSAFSLYFNEKHDNLANAVKEATYCGIKNAAVDVDINEWAKDINEIMESYHIHPIINLGGHNIEKGIIHGGYFLPAAPNDKLTYTKFKEGVFAIETFGSTGDNVVENTGLPTIYRTIPSNYGQPKLNGTNKFLNKIKSNFKTLPFTDRYLETENSYKSHLEILTKNKFLFEYPPLCVKNGITAQYEHTIYISDEKKIVFSKWDDY